jgi:hypothetical protein
MSGRQIKAEREGRSVQHSLGVNLAVLHNRFFFSNEGAAAYVDSVIVMFKSHGWKSILLRGDTDFSQTEHLDRWDHGGVQFHFGYDATPNLKETAAALSESEWTRLDRPSGVRLTDKRRQKT